MSTAAPTTTTTTTTTTSDPPPASLTLLTTFIPPNPTRAWQSAPHPTLPILATCFADKTVRIYSLTCLPSSSTLPPPSQPHPTSTTSDTPHTSTTPNPPHTSTPPNPTTTTPPPSALLSTITGGHKRSIRTVAWKPVTSIIKGESVLATGSFDASVGIWRRFETDGYGIQRGGAVDVAAAASGGHHHDNDDNEEEEEDDDDDEWNFSVVLDGHESEVKSIAWSVGGNLLATCSRDKSVWIWEEVGSGGGDEESEFETVAVLQEHEGDVKTVAWHPEEECLVSGSYDDEVRVWREEEGEDWGCVFRGRGHGGTVWGVAWEGVRGGLLLGEDDGRGGGGDGTERGMRRRRRRRAKWRERREKAGPRFLSCSDDGTVRVWRKVPREREKQRPMSIIRNGDAGEEWVQETTLPKVHERSIYAVGWSQTSGRVVSCGGDGRVVVYGEGWREYDEEEEEGADTEMHDSDRTSDGKETETEAEVDDDHDEDPTDVTTWKIIAQIEAAHGVFEINHVAWARKPRTGPQQMRGGDTTTTAAEDAQELIVTTGDDGAVKVWDLDI